MGTILLPREGIGAVKLGMSRGEVRAVLGVPFTSFLQNRFAESATDDFVSIGLHVDYDRKDVCNFITALRVANPTFERRPIIGVPFSDCEKWFLELDADAEVSDVGLISRKLGISIYASGAEKNPCDPVEAVSVFAEGYYD